MRKYRNAIYRKREIHVITCNVCGDPIKQNELGYFEDFITIEKTWGYGSEFDGETHVLDICSCCYKKLLDSFEVAPSSNNLSELQKDATGN